MIDTQVLVNPEIKKGEGNRPTGKRKLDKMDKQEILGSVKGLI